MHLSSAVFRALCILSFGFAPSFPSESAAGAGAPGSGPESIKLAFEFKGENPFQMALTPDSVGVLRTDPGAGGLEPDDESDGIENALAKRALSGAERDTAAALLRLAGTFKGNPVFACPRDDGYGFSVWSDSLSLHCRNCFSCTDGVDMPAAKRLAHLGRLTLWLYRLRDGLAP